MEKRGDAFFMTFKFPTVGRKRLPSDRTGWPRGAIEQYLTKQQDNTTRLPSLMDLVPPALDDV